MRMQTPCLAAALLAASSLAQQFIVPPDLSESSLPDTILSYAFGQTMLAQWWTPWQTVTLKLNTCDQDKTFTLFTSQPNQNNYTFALTTNLTGPCSGYSLSITAVTDADGYPAKGLVLNSQHFKILNVTTASSVVGTFTEPVTTRTGSSKITYTLTTTILASTGTKKPSLVTDQIAASGVPATATQAASASAAASETNSNSGSALRIGLGVGLGLGIPIVIAALVGLVCFRRLRASIAGRTSSKFQDSKPPAQQAELRSEMPMNQSTAKSTELQGSLPHTSEAASQPLTPANGKLSELEGETERGRHELAAPDAHRGG